MSNYVNQPLFYRCMRDHWNAGMTTRRSGIFSLINMCFLLTFFPLIKTCFLFEHGSINFPTPFYMWDISKELAAYLFLTETSIYLLHLLLYYYKNVRQLMTHNKPFKGSKIEGGKSYTMRPCCRSSSEMCYSPAAISRLLRDVVPTRLHAVNNGPAH